MPFPKLSNPLVPKFKLIINGFSLAVRSEAHVVDVTVSEDTSLPSMFAIEIVSSESNNSHFQWIDDEQELFVVGNTVEAKMGYGDDLETLIIGEITGIEPEFSFNHPPKLVVRGYDRLHRLQRGCKTRTFIQMKDSDIAAQIAREAGLDFYIEDSSVVHDYVLQANRTDMNFLKERARRINYEVGIEDKTLFFQPIVDINSPACTLSLAYDLLEFYPRLSSMHQVSEVLISNWDSRDIDNQLQCREGGDETLLMGGQNSGAVLSERAFDVVASEKIIDQPVMTLAEAEQLAKARLNQSAMSLITGDGMCFGRTDLRAGKFVEIEGVGKKFSGQYYITATSHRYNSSSHYMTHFSFKRNAI